MSNESTSTMPNCKGCGVELTSSYRFSCDKCSDRSDNSDRTYELALVEDELRRLTTNDGERWQRHAYAVQQRRIAQALITDGSDPRIENLWQKLWDALDGDIERDQTWGMFMDAIPGLPDYRVKTYSGVITLKFYFDAVEVEGSLEGSEIEEAICDAIRGDLSYSYADECEVEYDKD